MRSEQEIRERLEFHKKKMIENRYRETRLSNHWKDALEWVLNEKEQADDS